MKMKSIYRYCLCLLACFCMSICCLLAQVPTKEELWEQYGKALNDDIQLKKKNDETTLVHKTVFRPWGFYTCLNRGKGWLSKIITVLPGHKLSLQSHNFRSEHWIVLEGTAFILLNGEKHSLSSGKSINIPVKAKHSLQNHTKEPLKILEVQKGDYISEDDIIRYEDMYGRVK